MQMTILEELLQRTSGSSRETNSPTQAWALCKRTRENPRNPDAEDLYQEILVRVVQGLRRKKLSAREVDIENFRHYVIHVALNVCIDYLRSKAPARTRLIDSLRDLLNRHKDLAAWEYDGGLRLDRTTS